MSREKHRISQTPAEKITSEIRGEVGEAIASWIMWRWIRQQSASLQTDDIAADMRRQDQVFLGLLSNRIHDDLVGRIAELGARKIGRVNFHFAAAKTGAFHTEVDRFIGYVERNRFIEKRNYDVSHKELTTSYGDVKFIRIKPREIATALGMALRLIKKFDRIVVGPAAPFLWREMRRKRYELTAPARVAYMLLPYLRLSNADRLTVAMKEASEEHLPMWEAIETVFDGQPGLVEVNRKWGLIRTGPATAMAVEHYPLQAITSFDSTSREDGESSDCG